jgi:hypothetical protein
MADITVTAASVVPGDGAVYLDGIFGATVTAGQLCYRDMADGAKFKLAQNDGTLAESQHAGVAINGGASGQPGRLQTDGDFNPGGTVVVGELYLVSATAGAIAQEADVGSGKYVSFVGIGITTSKIRMGIINSGVQVPAA